MITVCSRCKRVISEKVEGRDEEKISHGICSQCLAVLESKIRQGPNCPIHPGSLKNASFNSKEHG